MSGQANSQVRKVRCPKCMLVLRELPEVPIYRCGGCSAILQGENVHPSKVEQVDENSESLLIITSADAETFLETVTSDQIINSDNFLSEGIPLDNFMSPHRDMQQVEGGMIPVFRHVSSDDTLGNTSHYYANGDLGVTLRSLTARKYYASSNDTEDQMSDRRFQLLKGSSEDRGPRTKILPERSEYLTSHVTSKESELHQFINSRSSLQRKKYSTRGVSRWHQDELLESARYSSPVRNRISNETDDYHSRLLFNKYSSQVHQGNSSSSDFVQEDFSTLPDNRHDLHRLELLRMVYELQDQLKRTQLSEGMPHGRFLTRPFKGKEHHFAENRKDYSDHAYHNNHGRYRQDMTWLKNREISPMVLPEDSIHYKHRVDCLCLCCRGQEQYPSAEQHPHAICYREEQSMTNARKTSRTYRCASSSHHRYAASDFSLRSQDMKPDDRQPKKHKEAQIHHIAKRHFQPIAGGAPIVACYHCSETLQLPAEFLVFKRRCHQLICGACSKVLKFSLENKIHVVQYDLISRTPLPSVSASRRDDYTLAEPGANSAHSESFSRSQSTGDNFSDTPSKFSSASSFKTPKEGSKSGSTRQSVYKNRSAVESFRSARSSSLMLDSEHSGSESEVESPLPGSALHKLMGYSSIRRLVFQ
ncbi:hypothetical protein DCAR_0520659 [Daucus carota subsp. sativus]|uniref:Zinc-ribbon domain-containing protein n=1 Tax=Daucus carota subsp. sativus TaxID=79200 RepID=A0AAF0X6B4_DAUCS|nr:hypothetical protein DCAR_0520659 [Daucus carota subsp. sativus]